MPGLGGGNLGSFLKSLVAGMKWPGVICVLLLALSLPARADFSIARGGSARCVIVQQPGATLAESNAVRELAGTLGKITGATFLIQEAKDANVPERAIIVGPGAAASALFPEGALDKLGSEEVAMRVEGGGCAPARGPS